ncbi:MAG: MBL fold metallo-hydrolase [Chloroflexi bacterium]|nr:MBL fold metallo-hydrolase [Chloroflexota bacterium]MBM3174498.1 MBL fold metallo-hydrolase [Chloroflexota bacterium]MBM4449552.1 MBL fold metallo-hydrolase [Chloroflexota bacterium]
MKTPEITRHGKENGEGMVVHYRTARGTDVFGLGVPNIYSNTDWDLGPTWCYLVLGDRTTLIDTGRRGNVEVLQNLLKATGKRPSDIDRIVVSHSHEDHDGNLADLLPVSQAELGAHTIYSQMIAYHTHVQDGARHPDLPGSCRMCFMPEIVRRECLPYHQRRSALKLDFAIQDGETTSDGSLRFLFTPGHSPDAVCVVLDDEVIFTGDTVLPDITSHPSSVSFFHANRLVLPEEYRAENQVYGLLNYIKSLSSLASISPNPIPAFPAHRLFYNSQFNLISDVSHRARDIIQFHLDRCRAILEIIGDGTISLEEIAVRHFPSALLQGMGKTMALNEILTHLELLQDCGDVQLLGEKGDKAKRTGLEGYAKTIQQHLLGS